MIQLILFLSVAGLLFLALILLARRAPRAQGGAEALVEARQALSNLQSGLLPAERVQRVFSGEDLEFVVGGAPRTVCRLFLAERKRIAVLWVSEVRCQVANLRRFYLAASRRFARLSFRTEVELALNFALLLFACRTLQVVIRLRGPYAALGMVRTTAAAAERIAAISEKGLAFMNPVQAGNMAGPRMGPAVL